MSCSIAPLVMAISNAVRRSLVLTVGCRLLAPKIEGSTSKAPPVINRPSIFFR